MMDDAPQPTRPDSGLLERSFVSFYADPLLSVSNLREAALKGLIPQRGLRSLHWRVSTSLWLLFQQLHAE